MSKLAAIVLAAGVSSRMGNFKPMLQVDGQTMIRRVVDSMRAAGASPIIVVTGYHRDVLEQHLDDDDINFVHNPRYYATQMLDSLLLGASALPADTQQVLISPADVPLIKEDTMQALLKAKGDFIRPSFDGKPGHPVLATPEALDRIRAFQNHSDGLRGAIAACGIVPVDVVVDDLGTTLDGDTRDEYANLLKYRRQQTNMPQPLQLDLRLCLHAETSFWGPECAQFLELIQTTGSMLNACQCMHMSYSRGWKMINEIERQLGYPLLLRSQGGPSGGGSALTPKGRRFLSAFLRMQEEIRTQSQAIFDRYFPEGYFPDTTDKEEFS